MRPAPTPKELGEQLRTAAANGNLEEVTALLEWGVDVDLASTYDLTALMHAAENGHTEVVAFLLDKEANVDLADIYGLTALMHAAGNGHTEVVASLLEKGATVDSHDKKGLTALMRAVEKGDTEVVAFLLDKGANVDWAREKDGLTALLLAAGEGRAEIVTALLEKGATVDSHDKKGETALMFAAQRGHTEVITALLKVGANVNLAGRGMTALLVATGMSHTEVVNAIVSDTILFQINSGADWQKMIFSNQDQPSQLDDPKTQNLLTRETVTLLAIFLPEGELRNSIVKNFNKRNARNHLDQGEESEIANLRKLISVLKKGFLPEINPSAASAANTAVNNQAESLANAAVVHLLANPSQLADFKNYLEARSDGIAVSSRLDSIPESSINYLIHNPILSDSQNHIVRQTLQDFFITTQPIRDLGAGAGAGSSEASAASSTAPSAVVTEANAKATGGSSRKRKQPEGGRGSDS